MQKATGDSQAAMTGRDWLLPFGFDGRMSTDAETDRSRLTGPMDCFMSRLDVRVTSNGRWSTSSSVGGPAAAREIRELTQPTLCSRSLSNEAVAGRDARRTPIQSPVKMEAALVLRSAAQLPATNDIRRTNT